MPWKNGGGVTTEIWVSPPGSGLAGAPFDWRVSIADVASDGPFSKFAGYDRHIMLLNGRGMRLETDENGVIDLALYRPAAFSGDWTIVGKLSDGPVRDFNLMVARQQSSRVAHLSKIDGTPAPDRRRLNAPYSCDRRRTVAWRACPRPGRNGDSG